MKLYLVWLLTILTGPALRAATITEMSGQTLAVVKTGDTLAFEIHEGSFAKNAVSFGLFRYPTEFTFALISAPQPVAGAFSASLRSADGSVSVDLDGPLGFHDGSISGSRYQGAISTLQGYLQLSPLLSQGLFEHGPAILTLRNDGPEMTIDLEPYTIREDLFVSLASGPMSVGGVLGSITLQSAAEAAESANPVPARAVNLASFGGSASPGSVTVTPEPESSTLFLAGGTLLCGISLAMARMKKGDK